MFTTQGLGESVYPDTPMGLEDNVEGLDHMLLGEANGHPSLGSMGQIINPIDKLYSMHTSYFNGEWPGVQQQMWSNIRDTWWSAELKTDALSVAGLCRGILEKQSS